MITQHPFDADQVRFASLGLEKPRSPMVTNEAIRQHALPQIFHPEIRREEVIGMGDYPSGREKKKGVVWHALRINGLSVPMGNNHVCRIGPLKGSENFQGAD